MTGLKERIKNIYAHIGNDVSKEIYINRLLYSLTDDNKYMKKVIETTPEGKEFLSKLYCEKKKIIFSAGAWGKEILKTYQDVEFVGFVDNRIGLGQVEDCLGYPVISYDEYLKDYSLDTVVVIASRLYYKEIYNQLKSANISDEYILNAGEMIDNMSVRQYFDLPEMEEKRLSTECFIDAGSFDGRTSLQFFQWCKMNVNHKSASVWAFEPDINNLTKCEKTLSSFVCDGEKKMSYHLLQKGLWNKKKNVSFAPLANGTSKVVECGEIQIQVDRLDEMIPTDIEVTFIKMDLEGAEYEALLGASEIIKKYSPKLAISIYHNPQDILELSSLILRLNPKYKLYMGHYSIAAAETVLYAL